METEKPEYKYRNVLLVDDNDLDNFINQKMLESNNFSRTIHISTNGKVALDFIAAQINSGPAKDDNFPDVMFVDLNMPVMSGFELIVALKKTYVEKLLHCKIIILSSSIHAEDRLKAERIDSGILFLNKPLTNELLNAI